MSTFFLHVGTPKTGTTAIQSFLAMQSNQKVLEKHGYAYPLFREYDMSGDDAVIARNAHPLIYGEYQNIHTYDQNQHIRDRFFEDVRKLLDSGKNVIVSDESVWHVCNKIDSFYKNIYEKIKSYGHEMKVIIYLRRQDDFVQSYWRYKVMIPRRHLRLSFKKFIEKEKYGYFPLDYFNQISMIADSVGGKENVIVRAYEYGQFAGSPPNIIEDFFECVGLKLTDEYKSPSLKRNPGLDVICCEVKRRINADPELQNNNEIRKMLIEITEENAEQGLYKVDTLFSKKDGEAFMHKYEESNKKTAEVFLGRSDGRLFYKTPEFENKSTTKFRDGDYLDICYRLMRKLAAENDRLMAENVKLKTVGNNATGNTGFLRKVKRKLKGK